MGQAAHNLRRRLKAEAGIDGKNMSASDVLDALAKVEAQEPQKPGSPPVKDEERAAEVDGDKKGKK
jgi:hypothetical protein